MNEKGKIVSTHDLKTNLSRYIRQLEQGELDVVLVRRYKKPLAILIKYKGTKKQ